MVVEVRDHGPGIDPEHATRVFERFYRVDSSRGAESGGGAGLGMAIVAAIVSAHGGSVGLEQTPGGGTTVRVALPVAPPAGQATARATTPDTARPPGQPAGGPPENRPPTRTPRPPPQAYDDAFPSST